MLEIHTSFKIYIRPKERPHKILDLKDSMDFQSGQRSNFIQDRIVEESERFVVVNKPPCVPSAPVVDNILESVPAFTGNVSTLILN